MISLKLQFMQRAVNQSIGRSMSVEVDGRASNADATHRSRHANDWSAILLLDARYSQPATQAKLPAWSAAAFVKPMAADFKNTGSLNS